MPGAQERPLKRTRGSACDDSYELVRHKTLYLEDGDIVLTAPSVDGQKRLVFRVDKIFLARHSPIFKDMLVFGPGQDAEDVFEGVPRVDLTDNAEDLAMLLSGLYNISTLLQPKFDPNKPVRMIDVMRLATKYEIEGIKRIIIKDVEDDWPTSLSAYVPWREDVDNLVEEYGVEFWRHVPEPASAMQFATEFSCAEITTSIIYSLARSPADYVLPASSPDHTAHRIRWHLLDSTNLYRVLRAQAIFRDRLSQFRTQLTRRSDDCMSDSCGAELAQFVEINLTDYCDTFNLCTDMLDVFFPVSVCHLCFMRMATRVRDLNTELWRAMRECALSEPLPWPQLDS